MREQIECKSRHQSLPPEITWPAHSQKMLITCSQRPRARDQEIVESFLPIAGAT